MRSGRCLLLVLGQAALCACAAGQVVVGEYAGYELGRDYVVTIHEDEAHITILQPSDPGVPYTFDCDWEGTTNPAIIGLLTADEGVGTVEVQVTAGHGIPPRPYGAASIDWLYLGAQGVTGIVYDLDLAADLGADGDTIAYGVPLGATWVIPGTIYNAVVLTDFQGEIHCYALDGDFMAGGPGPHGGKVWS